MKEADCRFEVAISFAGDNKRDVVRKIASGLRQKIGDGKIFFDEWYEAEVAGHDASNALQKIYRDDSFLVVACLCGRYGKKPWTQEEWRAIQSFERKIRQANTPKRFLPLRFGDGEVDGVFDTAIVPDMRHRSVGECVDFILERLEIAKTSQEKIIPAHTATDKGPVFPEVKRQATESPISQIDIPSVTIIGSGFSGTATAIRLLHLARRPIKLNIIEANPKQRYGGLAFGDDTTGWEHVLNIQAGRISLYRENPIDFLTWVNSEASREIWPKRWSEQKFKESSPVPRKIYREYLRDRFNQEMVRNSELVSVTEISGEVISVRERATGVKINYLPFGQKSKHYTLDTDIVLLSTGHANPALPSFVDEIKSHPRFVASAYSSKLSDISRVLSKDDIVLIVGSGLSSFDALLTLMTQKFSGQIIVCSRNGFIHNTYPDMHSHDIIRMPAPQLPVNISNEEELVAAIEGAVELCRAFLLKNVPEIPSNIAFERILKSLEPWIKNLLSNADDEIISSFLKNYSSWLTTRRTNVVPEVGNVVSELFSGPGSNARLVKGRISSLKRLSDKKINVTITGETEIHNLAVNALICCTGLETNYNKVSSPLWRSLIDESDLAVPHKRTLKGIEVGPYGQLQRKDESLSNRLFALGPMRQGQEILDNGRLGAFVFSIGTIRNQAFLSAAAILQQIENQKYTALNSAAKIKLDQAVKIELERSKEKKKISHCIDAIKYNITNASEFDNIVDIQLRCNEIFSILPLSQDEDLGTYSVFNALRFMAIKELTDIRRLPENYAEVKNYGIGDPSDFVFERLQCKRILKELVRTFNAESASLFVYKSLEKTLYPFVDYRRREKFTSTNYGEAVTGNLLKSYSELTEFPNSSALQACVADNRIRGVIIPDYNALDSKNKKSTYTEPTSHRRLYPSVIVALLVFEESPSGIIYLEAREGRCFSCSEVEELIEKSERLSPMMNDANIRWIPTDHQDHSGEDLKNADYAAAELSGANFRNAQLSGTRFRAANLIGADLSGAFCEGASFREARLSNARLINARVVGADLTNSDVRGSSLDGAVLRRSKLINTKLSGATLEGVDFSESLLLNIRFVDHSLKGVNFDNTTFRKCHFSALEYIEYASWQDAVFDDVTMDEETFLTMPRIVQNLYKDDIKISKFT